MLERPLALTSLAALAWLCACGATNSSPGANSTGGSAAPVGGGSATPGAAGSAAPGGIGGTNPQTIGGSSAGGTFGGTGGRGGALAVGDAGNGGAGGSPPAAGGAPGGGASAGAGGQKASGAGGTVAGGAGAGSGSTSAGVRIVGRTAPGTNGAVRFSWSGVTINAHFSGTQVSMDLNDGSNKNRFTVVIDGGAAKTVTSPTGQASLQLATGLTNGQHDLLIWRNTEASTGVTQFTGLSNFGSGGGLLAPKPSPDRRIEMIGDSLTAGAGVEGNAACPGGINAFTNNYLAYGSIAARAVGADVVTIAWSGIGVFRNSDGGTTNVMPTRYPFSIPNDNTLWDFTKYLPQVVVLNLGTNDFGPGDPGTDYETAYVNFIKTVRSKYPAANFILIDMYGGVRLTRINTVVSTLKSGGDNKVEALSVSMAQNNLGCGMHPNVAGQAAMGAVLTTRLKSLMNW